MMKMDSCQPLHMALQKNKLKHLDVCHVHLNLESYTLSDLAIKAINCWFCSTTPNVKSKQMGSIYNTWQWDGMELTITCIIVHRP